MVSRTQNVFGHFGPRTVTLAQANGCVLVAKLEYWGTYLNYETTRESTNGIWTRTSRHHTQFEFQFSLPDQTFRGTLPLRLLCLGVTFVYVEL